MSQRRRAFTLSGRTCGAAYPLWQHAVTDRPPPIPRTRPVQEHRSVSA